MNRKKISAADRVRLIQNEVFGATIIYEAAKSFHKTSEKMRGIPLASALMILPVVLDDKFSTELSARKTSTALFRVIVENPNLRVGFQKRLQNFANLSCRAIHLGLNSGLLKYDLSKNEILPGKVKGFRKIEKNDRLAKASRRFGEGSFYLGINQLSNLLEVRF